MAGCGSSTAPQRLIAIATLAGMYISLTFTLIGYADRTLVVLHPLISAAFTLPLILAALYMGRQYFRNVPVIIRAIAAASLLAASGAGVIGLLSGQAVSEIVLGTARLVVLPFTALAALTAKRQRARSWLFSTYLRHARATQAVLLVGMIVAGLSRGYTPLPLGNGLDPVLYVSGLGLAGSTSSRSTFDFILTMAVALLSLKRAAWVAVVAGLIMILSRALVIFFSGPPSRAVERSGLTAVAPRVVMVATAAVLALAIAPLQSRAETIFKWLGGAPSVSIDVRVDENRVATDLFASADVATRTLGYGAGHRFAKGAEDTGALHNSYLTVLVLGGLLSLSATFLVLVYATLCRPPAPFAVALALFSVLALQGNALLDPLWGVLVAAAVANGKRRRWPSSRAAGSRRRASTVA